MAERHRSIQGGEGYAEGGQPPNQSAGSANNQPYITNPLHRTVPFLLTPNSHGGLPSMAGNNNEPLHPVTRWNYSYSFSPHRLGGNMAREHIQIPFPSPGPRERGGLAATAYQLPIWNMGDLPVDVFVQDIGEHGFYLTAMDQVVCLMIKSMVADKEEKLQSLRQHFGENVELFLERIAPCIEAIPPGEMRRLIQYFLPFPGTSASYFVPASGVIVTPAVALQSARQPAPAPAYPVAQGSAPSLSHDQPNATRQFLPNHAAPSPAYPSTSTYTPASSSVNTSGLPTAGPNSSAEAPHHLRTAESSLSVVRPTLTAAQARRFPNTPIGQAGPSYPAVVAAPPTTASPFGASPPSVAARPRPDVRRVKEKAAEFQWSNKQSAFIVYYQSQGYLLSEVQRMFMAEFEGTEPTIKDIRERLFVINTNDGHGLTRYNIMGQIAQGTIQFKAQKDKVPVPSDRSQREEFETPFRARHKNFVRFFQEIGLDSALTHELFELHFKGTITQEQLDGMWKKPVRGMKQLLLEAHKAGWFKYLEERQIGHVNFREVQKNITKAQARIRATLKKESIKKAIREDAEREKRGAAASNVDDTTMGEAEGSEQAEKREEADRDGDNAADSVEGEAEGGEKKMPNVRGKRPLEDRERSRSPKS